MSFRTACIFLLLANANAQVLTERDAINAFLTGSPQAAELQAGIEAVEAETRSWSLWANPDVSYSREGASANQSQPIACNRRSALGAHAAELR